MAKKQEDKIEIPQLTTNEVPLTESEKEQLQEVLQIGQGLSQQLGNVAVRKIVLENEELSLKQQFVRNQEKEIEFTSKITQKYGVGSINIQEGMFVPTEQPN